MRTQNFEKWIAELRTTDKPQGKETLARVNDDSGVLSYCCLGIGCELAGIKGVDINMPQEDGEGELVARAFGGAEHHPFYDLAPPEFIQWLFEVPVDSQLFHMTGSDLSPDFGDLADLPEQGPESDPTHPVLYQIRRNTAAHMNDAGMTFAQIADVFDYFGVLYPEVLQLKPTTSHLVDA